MAFVLTLAYLFFTLVPPGELHPGLARANVMDVLGVLAVIVGFVELAISQRRRKLPVQLALVVMLVLWATLSIVLALRWFGGAVLVLQSVIVNFGLFWLITLTGNSLLRLNVIRIVWLATLAMLVVFGIQDFRSNTFGGRFVLIQGRDVPVDETLTEEALPDSNPEDQTVRVGRRRLMALGYLADPNQFAQILVASMPLLFLGWHPGRMLVNLTLVPVGTLLVYGIVLTGSRGGLVALAATVAAAAFLQRRRWLSRLTVASVLVVLPIAFILARRSAREDDSAAGRMEAWSYGLQLLKESPLWGAGYGSFIEGHQLTAHNSFVLCFAELGLVGYLLWLSIFVVSFLQLSQIVAAPAAGSQIARWAGGMRLALIGFLAAAFFLSRTFSVLLFLLVGMATAVISVAKDSKTELAPLRPGRVFLTTGIIEIASIVVIYVSMRLVR